VFLLEHINVFVFLLEHINVFVFLLKHINVFVFLLEHVKVFVCLLKHIDVVKLWLLYKVGTQPEWGCVREEHDGLAGGERDTDQMRPPQGTLVRRRQGVLELLVEHVFPCEWRHGADILYRLYGNLQEVHTSVVNCQ